MSEGQFSQVLLSEMDAIRKVREASDVGRIIMFKLLHCILYSHVSTLLISFSAK